eukprot:768322-Rhodomonas_salina.1
MAILRGIFQALKAVTGLPGYRVFTTGISPVPLADASGYNVAQDLTNEPAFSSMLGFCDDAVTRA